MFVVWHCAVLLFSCTRLGNAEYFPFRGTRPLNLPTGAHESNETLPDSAVITLHSRRWQAPLLQPWDALRATETTVTVAWTPAWNPWSDVAYYELQARRPAGYPLVLADRVGLQLREADTEVDRPFEEHKAWADEAWTSWDTAYHGRGRTFTMRVEARTAPAVQFRVRACGKVVLDGCSEWSPVQTTHTVLKAEQDKINFHILGTGKNAHNYTILEFNRVTLYKRRDETGLVLAIFSRLDFSLQWLRTYDTHRSRKEALQMSKDIRKFNQSYFVVVASTIAWEWRAPHSLAKTMEFCGAYHFGQWAHVFAEQSHYFSDRSDLQQNAGQDEFGHPYAFIGIPGIGAGHGWESLMHNTGQYLARNVKNQDAVIRGVAYYDYVFRIYRLGKVLATKADFYRKAIPPGFETLHNPVPRYKLDIFRTAHPIGTMEPPYVPYIGTLQNSLARVMEANGTVPPYNFAFMLATSAGIRKVDPRSRFLWVTEIERIWGGSSERFWDHNSSLLNAGTPLDTRNCKPFVEWTYNFASPELCGDAVVTVSMYLVGVNYGFLVAEGFEEDIQDALRQTTAEEFERPNGEPSPEFRLHNINTDMSQGPIKFSAHARCTFNVTAEFVRRIARTAARIQEDSTRFERRMTALVLTELERIQKKMAAEEEEKKRKAQKNQQKYQPPQETLTKDALEVRASVVDVLMEEFGDCCNKVDDPDLPVFACGTGISPTLCRNSTVTMVRNSSAAFSSKWPYEFRVIDWDA